ncbi:MAG: rhomboid family intramembrane serine protease [Desulfobulbaceae bacterium]|nr:rhomboid family intramembrane serine protease [Candidatus Kapabacteria bacterium]MBS3999879.1 rhomboid family intramembrane serine protease [Desulfobulbaceae bacterium]
MKMRGMGSFSLFPPVMKMLLIINVAVFILQYLFLSGLTFDGHSLNALFMKYFALQPFNSENMFDLSKNIFLPWQLVSYQFMHGGLWHLFFNMFALWMFGSELEGLWGSKRFLIYYLLAGVGAAIVHMFVTPLITGLSVPTVGASGSVYGILLAFAFTFPNRPIFMFPFFIPIPAKYFVLIFVVIEMISGVSGGSGIAHFAHLGGALTGFILLKWGDKLGVFKWFSKKSDTYDPGFGTTGAFQSDPYSGSRKPNVIQVKWAQINQEKQVYTNPEPKVETRGKYIIDGEEITQVKIDSILDKISESGYQNLTEREKFILTELSKRI